VKLKLGLTSASGVSSLSLHPENKREVASKVTAIFDAILFMAWSEKLLG